ncbi:MAG: Thermonuclease [Bryobacteraceae bacterium]|nr:Thermonuclease [Bryobacteraceae bacterium]
MTWLSVAPVLLASCVCAAQTAGTVEFQARVISIVDGDTITILHDGVPERIRLHGIDCPERKQAFGTRAKQFTGRLAREKTVTLRTHGKDRYGRTIAEVILPDGRNLNHEIVRAGLAWWFRKYAPWDEDLSRLESEARTDKRGIWSEPGPMSPWTFRLMRKTRRKAPLPRSHGE